MSCWKSYTHTKKNQFKRFCWCFCSVRKEGGKKELYLSCCCCSTALFHFLRNKCKGLVRSLYLSALKNLVLSAKSELKAPWGCWYMANSVSVLAFTFYIRELSLVLCPEWFRQRHNNLIFYKIFIPNLTFTCYVSSTVPDTSIYICTSKNI